MPEIPFAHEWTIPENQLLPLKDSIDGRLFSTRVSNIPEFDYYLSIFPNGNTEQRRGQTWIFLHLVFKDVKNVEVEHTFAIESANFSNPFHCIYKQSESWGPCIFSTEEFFDPEKKCIVDGKFTVKLDGIFKFETALSAAIGNNQQKWIGGELGDELWMKHDTKDFVVAVGDKEIKVHKFILENRSDVFTAMFNANMEESKENKVKIPDFSFAVVETGIKLIYDCNFASSLSIDESMQLLQFLDKYNLETLKAKLERLLIDQISASTVVRITNGLALTNSPKLKEHCMEFLSVAFASKTSLCDFKILDKDIVFEVVENSFYQHLETRK